MFYDQAKITVKGGNGGDGSIHMRREKFVTHGGPDGGDGGRGGSVYVQADASLNTLLPFRFKRNFKAEPGGKGGRQRSHGAAGEDLIIAVPPGTVVHDSLNDEVVADVLEVGQRFLIARGGKGGLGNTHFATSTQRTPTFAQTGEPGQERELELELRVIADVGLVGYPNAGKSSLLAAISAATPKIADYPFTTLEPNLGVVGIDDASFVVADIPGLIEGAHEGAGLGHEFLRHVERSGLLIHVIDTAGVDGRSPVADFDRINAELSQHSPALAIRPQIVAANKLDLPAAQEWLPKLERLLAARGVPVYPISAATREGLEPLLRAVASRLAELKRDAAELVAAERRAIPIAITADYERYTPIDPAQEVTAVRDEDGVFRVSGRAAERAVQMTGADSPSARRYLRHRLRQTGVDDALRRAGAKTGDMVQIGDVSLAWRAEPTREAHRRTARERKAGT